MTSARTKVTAFALGLLVGVCRSAIRMLMIGVFGNTFHIIMAVHAMVGMNRCHSEPARLALLWASHGCGHCAPEREQHANQQQNEGTKGFHVEKLSRGASICVC